MTDVLRLADQRPPAADDSGACSVALRAPCAAPESCLFPVDMGFLLHQILPIHSPPQFRAGPQSDTSPSARTDRAPLRGSLLGACSLGGGTIEPFAVVMSEAHCFVLA